MKLSAVAAVILIWCCAPAKAQQDGKLAAHVDVDHLSHLAGMHVSEGVRHWAAGTYGDRSFAEVVSRDIAAVIAGYNQLPA